MQHEERTIEEQDNQPLAIPVDDAQERGHSGVAGIVGIIIVILIIAISAATFFSNRLPSPAPNRTTVPHEVPPTPQDSIVDALRTQSDGIDIETIHADIEATDLNSIKVDFDSLEAALDASIEGM